MINKKDFLKLLGSVVGKDKKIDPEKAKLLPDQKKKEIIKFLISDDNPIPEFFICVGVEKLLLKKGYRERINNGRYDLLCTYWQSIKPKY